MNIELILQSEIKEVLEKASSLKSQTLFEFILDCAWERA